MRKFRVVIETTKSYEVEVDDSKITIEDLEGWESCFNDLDLTDDKLESFVADYCEKRASQGDGFIEGHGRVLRKDRECPSYINKDEVCEYMKMIKADDGGYIEIDIRELKDLK